MFTLTAVVTDLAVLLTYLIDLMF